MSVTSHLASLSLSGGRCYRLGIHSPFRTRSILKCERNTSVTLLGSQLRTPGLEWQSKGSGQSGLSEEPRMLRPRRHGLYMPQPRSSRHSRAQHSALPSNPQRSRHGRALNSSERGSPSTSVSHCTLPSPLPCSGIHHWPPRPQSQTPCVKHQVMERQRPIRSPRLLEDSPHRCGQTGLGRGRQASLQGGLEDHSLL